MSAQKEKEGELAIVLRAVGEAPQLKKKEFTVPGEKSLVYIETALRAKLKQDRALYLYCGSGFAPTPEQKLKDLFDCFQINGSLEIKYGFQETWG
eukprot:gene9632-10648_t